MYPTTYSCCLLAGLTVVNIMVNRSTLYALFCKHILHVEIAEIATTKMAAAIKIFFNSDGESTRSYVCLSMKSCLFGLNM